MERLCGVVGGHEVQQSVKGSRCQTEYGLSCEAIRQASGHRPVVGGTETIKEAEAVLLHRHLSQFVLQTHGMDVDSLVTQKHRLHIGKRSRYSSCRTQSFFQCNDTY